MTNTWQRLSYGAKLMIVNKYWYCGHKFFREEFKPEVKFELDLDVAIVYGWSCMDHLNEVTPILYKELEQAGLSLSNLKVELINDIV